MTFIWLRYALIPMHEELGGTEVFLLHVLPPHVTVIYTGNNLESVVMANTYSSRVSNIIAVPT